MADDNETLDDQLDEQGNPIEKPPEGEPKVEPDSVKQIADLISSRDKEIARANRAEAALKLASAGKPPVGGDPGDAVLRQEVREASLDAVFAANPKLLDFGIDRELVEGATRAEMRESAAKLVALVEQIETKARNETLATHGLSPEPLSTTRGKAVDYSSMSKEEFEKAIEQAKRNF